MLEFDLTRIFQQMSTVDANLCSRLIIRFCWLELFLTMYVKFCMGPGGIGGTGVMLWCCQPGSSSFWEGSKPSGVTDGLKSSNTKFKRPQGGSCEAIYIYICIYMYMVGWFGFMYIYLSMKLQTGINSNNSLIHFISCCSADSFYGASSFPRLFSPAIIFSFCNKETMQIQIF